MLANNNLKVCRTLMLRDFKLHRVKMIFLVFAAALVTALFSFLFLLGGSVRDAFLLNYQYSYGSVSHILYMELTGQQADILAKNANVKSSVRIRTVGQLSDPMMGQRLVKLAIKDRAYAETVLSVPTNGRFPEQKNEIALDEFTMDSLGILHEAGAPVILQWTDSAGENHTSEFTLCGWWASPTNFSEACAWITEETAEELVTDENGENVTLGVTLFQTGDLEMQAASILEEQGLSGIAFTTTLAGNKARRETANRQAQPFYFPAVWVLLCGYLMIYAIIQVTSGSDISFYAGLKSLGMTPRQIGRMLAEQGILVSLLSLLPGWLLGFLLHLGITGRVVTGMDENPALYFLTWKPFALAAACTVGITLLAYLLPSVRIARMLPVRAAEEAEERLPRKLRGSRGRITIPLLALRTLFCRRRRTALSAVIMLFAALLVSSVWVQYVSMKEDIYLRVMSPWDYSLTDGSAYLSHQRYNEKNRGITEETVAQLWAQPAVTSVSVLKSKEILLTAPKELRQRIADYYNQPYDETRTLRDTQEAYPEWCQGLDRLERTGEYTGLIIGLDGAYLAYVLENCPFTSGDFDAEKFASGDYVLAGGAYYEGVSTQAAGEKVELAGQSFEVLGSIMHDNAYLSGADSSDAAFHIAYLIPIETFDRLFPGQGYRQLAVDIDHTRQREFEEYLEGYEQGLNRGVGIITRRDYQNNFQAARLNMALPKLIVSLVLLVIAVINFVNLLVVKTVSRRSEFAVYQSLGMTASQLRLLLLLEGGFHGAMLALVVGSATVLFDCFVMPKILEQIGSWVMVYTLSMTPLWVMLPVIALLALTVPVLCLKFMLQKCTFPVPEL